MNSPLPKVLSSHTSRLIAILLFLVILCSLCFGNSLKNPFLYWDDHVYIQNNPYLRKLSLSNLKTLFSRPYFKNYAPLHILSYHLDYRLWGFHPAGYRLLNIILHFLNSLFVFFLIREWYHNDKAALIGAAIFVVHPIHVESVVWLSQRKDVLSAFFFFLALYGYFRSRKNKNWSWYGLSLLFFSLALLTKPVAITLPLILILYEWCFPPQKIRIYWKDKIPFFFLSAVSAILTLWAQSIDTGIKHYVGHNFFFSVFLTGKIIVLYLGKLLLPLNLSARYVFPIQKFSDMATISFALSWIFLLLLMGWLLWLLKKKPSLAFPGCWFLITLLPVANLIPTSTQMADRYLYLPSLGYSLVIGLFVYAIGIWAKQKKKGLLLKGISIITAGGLIVFYGSLTVARNRVWRSNHTLWEDALKSDPRNYYAATYLANAYLMNAQKLNRNPRQKEYKLQKAKKNFQQGIDLKPTFAPALLGMGSVLIGEGKPKEAIPFLLQAQKYNDEKRQSLRIQHNLGIAYLKDGLFKEAEDAFHSALKEDPAFIPSHLALGKLSFDRRTVKGYQKAAHQYAMVTKLSPEDPQGYFYLAMALEQLGNFSSASHNYQKALHLITHLNHQSSQSSQSSLLNPADIHLNLGGLYSRLGDYPRAAGHYRELLRLDPLHPQAEAVRSIMPALGASF